MSAYVITVDASNGGIVRAFSLRGPFVTAFTWTTMPGAWSAASRSWMEMGGVIPVLLSAADLGPLALSGSDALQSVAQVGQYRSPVVTQRATRSPATIALVGRN